MKNQPDSPSSSPTNLPRLVGDDSDEDKPLLESESDIIEDNADDLGERTVPDSYYEVTGPAWQGYLFASVIVLAILFGTGRETWSRGMIALSLGLLMIFFAPQRKLPRPALACLGGAILAPLLAFFPTTWLFELPAWRQTLEQDWGVTLSHTLTPQAWVTFEAWLFFFLCLVWLGWCLTRGFSPEQRRAMVHTLALGGILLSILSILEGSEWVRIPWWPRNRIDWGHGFGPFANRNHISSFAAMTCVLCAAATHDAFRRKSNSAWLFIAGFIAPLTCIFMNSSRAGLVLLFLGMTLWLGTVAMRRGFLQKLAVSSSLIFIIATLLVMSGGNITKRLSEEGLATFASGQGRSTIFGECFKMILHSPWTGIGLGNFTDVFPQYARLNDPLNRYLHPESDLLWLLAEGGLLTLLPMLLLGIWISTSTGPWFGKKKRRKSGMQDRRLRNASAIAFSLGIIHGIADVPNHGLAYALLMSLLAGIAIRPRRLSEAASPPNRLLFRLCGIAILVLGAAWSAIALGHSAMPGASEAETLRSRANNLADSGSPAAALPFLNRATELRPMDFRSYYDRARIRLMLGQSQEAALADFSRARMLEPHIARLSYNEGVVWMDYNASYALNAWRETLRRWPGYNYWAMVQTSLLRPELREPLWTLATSIELKMEYLARVTSREEFTKCLQSILSQSQNLEGWESAQRENLFNLWSSRGDQASLIASLEANPKWRDSGWRVLAEHYARNSDFKRACETVVPYLPSIMRTSPGSSTDIPTLERALTFNPTDALRGIDLFQAQKTRGDIDGAIRTLEKVVLIPNAPSYVRQEIAALYVMKQDYRRAWEQLRETMQKR